MAHFYLWFKALHIAFMVTWFAGLFYLPRLFIYHAESADAESRARFHVMERRLFIMTNIGMALTWIFGLSLAFANPAVLEARWFSIKIALVLGLMVYQYRCWLWIGQLEKETRTRETRWLRWFNEIPVLVLLSVIILAVVKP
jgi:putative membrane protein